MSFDKKKINEILGFVDVAKYPNPLHHSDQETLDLMKDVTIGDLVIQFGCNVDEAAMVIKNTQLMNKKNAAPGFKSQVKESKILSNIKKVIEECACQDMQYDLTGDIGYDEWDQPHNEQTGMVKSNLYSIYTKAQSLHDMMGENQTVPEWVQEKIAVVDEYIDVISDYIGYEHKMPSKKVVSYNFVESKKNSKNTKQRKVLNK